MRHYFAALLIPLSAAVLAAGTLSGCDSTAADKAGLVPVGSPGPTPGTGSGSGTGTTGSTGASNGGGGTVPVTGVPNTGTTPAVNSVPTAVADVAVVQLNSTGNPVNVLVNDLDPNGDALKITDARFTLSVPPTEDGTVAPSADGLTLRYTPPKGFIGTQTVSYSISDGRGGVASALAVITVSPLPIPPVAVADAFTLMTDAAAVQLDVLANDLDGAGGGLTLVSVASVVTVPPNNGGTVSVVNNRAQYQPRPGFNGVETLLYTLRDANGATTSATVVITVLPVAAPPIAVLDAATIALNTSVDLDVLANDVDLAGGGLTLTAVSSVASVPPMSNGGFSVVANRVRYTPPSATFVGTQTATYTLTDINGSTATGLITLVITPTVPPVPPVAVPDAATLVGGSTSANLDVLANDLDPAGGGLTVTAAAVATSVPMATGISAATNGSAVQLSLPASYVGIITLTYTVRDANGSTATAAVVVTVQPAALPPTPPVLVPDTFTTMQDAAASRIGVLANDVDPAAGGLTLTAATVTASVPPGATHTVSLAGNQVSFTPATGFAGVVTVGYSVRDANGTVATTGVLTVVVTARPVTVPPVTVPDAATVAASAGPASIGVLANDVDTNGGGLTLTATSITTAVPAGAGTVEVSANAVRYTPTLAYTGLVTVGYTVTDSIGQTATGTLLITVVP